MENTLKVTLSDPLVTVKGWTQDLDELGAYVLRRRKTSQEMRLEKEERRMLYGDRARKVLPIENVHKTCLSRDPSDPSTVYFLPGLWPRIKKRLDDTKRPYEVIDKRNPDIRPPLDMTAFRGIEFRETQDVAVALLSSLDCGIIKTTTGYGKSQLIGWMCKAYPTLNIVVATSSTQVVATLYEYISKLLPGEVGMLGGGKDTSAGKRIVCTTLKSLPNIPPENVQLVFVDECHAVGDNLAGRDLTKFCWARRFGFSASPVRNDGTALVMESILGPVILEMSYQEATDAGMVTPMKYLMLPCDSCPPVAKNPELPEVMLKRWSYWCNKSRNNVIRRFVYDLKQHYKGQILIFVSTLEHAVQLNRLLPWFKVAFYGGTDHEQLKRKFPVEKYPGLDLDQYKMTAKQLDIMRNAFAKGTLRYVISTKVFKQGCNFQNLQVLIRADGDVSEIEGIQIPGRLSRLAKGKDYAYLVDIADTFSHWAEQRAQARDKLYRKQQWEPVAYQELIDELGGAEKSSEGDSGPVRV